MLTEYPDSLLLVCARCGCVTEGVRMSSLGKSCKPGFASPHTRNNWRRVQNQHPSPAKGDAKVLSELVPLRELLAGDLRDVR